MQGSHPSDHATDVVTASVRNETFTITRNLEADRAAVFAAFADDVTRWTSLVTVTLEDADDGGSTLTWTEQVALLASSGDGSADLAHLRTGTTLRLNGLPAALLL